MFKKRDPEPHQPRLQGEDFDIFPNLDDDDFRRRPAENANAVPTPEPEEPEAPPEPTELEKKIAAIPDDKWKKYQIIAGIVLGVLSTTCLMVLGRMESVSSFSLILAAVIALFVPNIIEKKGGRKIPVLRVALIISVVISMGLYAFYGFVLNPGYFAPTATPVPSVTPAPEASATVAP